MASAATKDRRNGQNFKDFHGNTGREGGREGEREGGREGEREGELINFLRLVFSPRFLAILSLI